MSNSQTKVGEQTNMGEIRTDILVFLKALDVPKMERLTLGNGMAEQFALPFFGVVICLVEKEQFSFVANKLHEFFKGWRVVYITPEDDLNAKKDIVLWELGRCGYFRWLRLTSNKRFTNLLTTSNLANRILKKRLSIYGDLQKYAFMKTEDESARRISTGQLLAMDPAFFDFIPEEEV